MCPWKSGQSPELPFDKAWIKQGVDFKLYRTLYIAPVNTDYLKKADWWKETVRAEQIQQDVQNLATFMRTQFIDAFQNDPRHRLRVVLPGKRLPHPSHGYHGIGSQSRRAQCPENSRSHGHRTGPGGDGKGLQFQSTVAFEAQDR